MKLKLEKELEIGNIKKEIKIIEKEIKLKPENELEIENIKKEIKIIEKEIKIIEKEEENNAFKEI